jgi:hypothetical protein
VECQEDPAGVAANVERGAGSEHDRADPQTSRTNPWQRFEHNAPNDLLQMDFKGHFQIGQGAAFL